MSGDGLELFCRLVRLGFRPGLILACLGFLWFFARRRTRFSLWVTLGGLLPTALLYRIILNSDWLDHQICEWIFRQESPSLEILFYYSGDILLALALHIVVVAYLAYVSSLFLTLVIGTVRHQNCVEGCENAELCPFL